mmetsp:Transcript_99472/g.207146  ORF Transcript_99472/g.207146 Transcript_99472/m.207146 type:complete len:82 (+) Transcript_99472:133-378(+)
MGLTFCCPHADAIEHDSSPELVEPKGKPKSYGPESSFAKLAAGKLTEVASKLLDGLPDGQQARALPDAGMIIEEVNSDSRS